MTIVAIVLAFITGSLFFSYLNRLERIIGDQVTVVAAAESIPARTQISPEMLTVQEIPRNFVHDSYFFNPQDLTIGYVALADIEEGQIIQRNLLDANAGLEPGFRAVALNTDLVSSVGGNVRPGNRVDVIVSYMNEENNPRTEVLLEDVKVLAVNNLLPSGDEAVPGIVGANRFLPSGQLIKDGVVTLSLRPDDSTRLVFMSNFGAEIRLVIRRLDELDSRPVDPVTMDEFTEP